MTDNDKLRAAADEWRNHIPSGYEDMTGYGQVSCSCGWDSSDTLGWEQHINAEMAANPAPEAPRPTYDGELATVAVCYRCGWGVYAHECPVLAPEAPPVGPTEESGPCVECGWYPTIEPENSRARDLRWARHKAHVNPEAPPVGLDETATKARIAARLWDKLPHDETTRRICRDVLGVDDVDALAARLTEGTGYGMTDNDKGLRAALNAPITGHDKCDNDYERCDGSHVIVDRVRAALAANPAPETDEEHCCNDPDHMSPEYLAELEANGRAANPAPEAPPVGLDVERLRQALDNEWMERAGDTSWVEEDADPFAKRAPRIAAEYARLTEGTGSE